MSSFLRVSHLSKSFQNQETLKDISFELPMGTIAALLGPSGSGKSTLLRCLSRLETWDSGEITFQDKPLGELAPCSIGMVFQGFHLFPHMTILKNLTHAPLMNRFEKKECHNQALALLAQFGLSDKTEAYPHQLSGGQKQRIAIARALMMNPTILLFDEPTSALDPEMVSEVAALIRGLKSRDRLIIMATHELKAAKLAADHILFLDEGSLTENASKETFFHQPQSARAQQFVNNMMV